MGKEVILLQVDDPAKAFWFCNGFIAHDLHELSDSLKKIDQSSFKHHVNDRKNDIAKWVEDILNDKRLAKRLYRVKTLKTTISKVNQRLEQYVKLSKRKQTYLINPNQRTF